MNKPGFVFDTNAFVSAVLLENSISAKAIDQAFKIGQIVISEETFSEFKQVLSRPKFNKYLSSERKAQAISKLERDTILFEVSSKVEICRDPKDNKFLELAVDADAACIISGDKDLLTLHPFQGISILSVADFLKSYF